jgi:hypothetical protein
MKATLGIEYIGESQDAKMRGLGRILGGAPSRNPWVAEIVGRFPSGKLERTFLNCNKDYKNANSVGSRGVTLWFTLEENKMYEVHGYASWKRSYNYFCAVTTNGKIHRLTPREATEWQNVL